MTLVERLIECADSNQRAMLAQRPQGARMAPRRAAKNSEWFSRMNAEEQEQYLREHPKSTQHRDAQTRGGGAENDDRPAASRPRRPARKPDAEVHARPEQTDSGRLDRPAVSRPGGASAHLQPADKDRSQWPEHVQQLRLPPAWTDVKISHDPDADLQAIGKDAKGRDQYVYSEKYARSQAALKFQRIHALHAEFHGITRQNQRDQRSDDPKTREHAECMALVMHMGLRPGSDDDTGADKKAYGASTLLGSHVTVGEDGRTRLAFVGKKGVDLDLPVPRADLARMLHERARRAGPEQPLFPNVSGASLLDYAHGLGSGGHKTKDFRTLKGTMTAHDIVAKMPPPRDDKEYERSLRDVATHVSRVLGNTPSVALASYISPAAFAPWDHARPSEETASTYQSRHHPFPQVHYGQVGVKQPRRNDPRDDTDDDAMPPRLPRSTVKLLGTDPRTLWSRPKEPVR